MPNPLVSIVCESYNHEHFLRKCLDGFVMQQTSFPFEILIHDDASTDHSADIIREYAVKYPDLFRPIYQTENQYSQKVNIWTEMQYPRVKGKYIAHCEGDDYWTDSLKLQKQVDYMESHPECSLCFHNAVIHWADGRQPDRLFAEVENRDYSCLESLEKWVIPTASIMFRTELQEGYGKLMRDHLYIRIGDRPLAAYCAQHGTLHGFSDVMSVYLKHEDGYTLYSDSKRTYVNARTWEEIGNAFGKEAKNTVKNYYTAAYLSALTRSVREKYFKIICQSFYRGILRQPLTGVLALAKLPKERKNRLRLQTNSPAQQA